MDELSREQIEIIQGGWGEALGVDRGVTLTLCDMALAYLDAKADAQRYRWWRNAKIAECYDVTCFDEALGEIENSCDLAEQIDRAIDKDITRMNRPAIDQARGAANGQD